MSLLCPLSSWGRGALLMCVVAGPLASGAQALRDPTLSPAAAQSAADAGRQSPAAVNPAQVAILVRGGVPYLVHNARLYAVGQSIGAARIDRISETEVWLHEAGAVRKIAVFQGIDRSAAARPAPATSATSVAPQHPVGVSRP